MWHGASVIWEQGGYIVVMPSMWWRSFATSLRWDWDRGVWVMTGMLEEARGTSTR